MDYACRPGNPAKQRVISMRQWILISAFFTLLINVFAEQAVDESDRRAYLLEIDGIIGPANADYLERALDKAALANAELILLRMDTPGGLDLSMRQIIKKILASPVPVISYVSPGGARAASAGTYILYASHIAAMAPGTNLGAATPVQIMPMPAGDKPESKDEKEADQAEKDPDTLADPMTHKMINDAVAYIKSLAKLRGRNEHWAEQAVRKAASLPAEEALKENVIDIVAKSQTDLFQQLDGRTVNVLGEVVTLMTDGLILEEIAPDWRNKLLEVITNPNIAYILMLVGIYGLIFEFSNPGAIVPGTVGAICLLLALFAFQVLPINYAGLALIILGIALMVAEAFVPSFGILGLGGVTAFVIGSVILIDTDLPGFGIDIGLVIGFALTTAILFILALGLVFKSRRHPVVSGMEEMIGAEGVALDAFDQQGRVRVHSEIWTARSASPVSQGEKVRVQAMKGLTLFVEPATTSEKSL